MRFWILLLGLAPGCARTPAEAQDANFWPTLDATLYRKGGLRATYFGQLRFDDTQVAPAQFMTGPVLRYDGSKHSHITAGYYYRRGERADFEWAQHRWFGSFEYDFVERERWRFRARTMVERFVGGTRPDFTRYRERLLVESRGSRSMYGSAEWMLDRHGLQVLRVGGGIRVRTSDQMEVDVFYGVDRRRDPVRRNIHLVITTFRVGGFTRN
jgi:hypothetical protein